MMLDIIDKHYNLEELRTLCLNLGIDYDNLGGEGKINKARELLITIYRQERLNDLLAQVAKDRPMLKSLPDVVALGKEASTWRKITTRNMRIRQTLIDNVRNAWIEGDLKHSIYSDALLTLDLKYTPAFLHRERPLILKDGDEESPVEISLFEVFQKHGRRLLILGEPGSGKTFSLLQLTEELLKQAEDDLIHPIPVVFNLSSWAKERQPFQEWLVTEMFTQYQLARKVTRAWLERDEFLLLLDGLDEVAEAQRDNCLMAINQFLANYQAEVVVCSRTADYTQLKKRLNVTTAVCIQSLNESEISQYLEQPGLELQAVRATLQSDESLRELTKSPLTLTVMTLAYRGLSADELRPFDSVEARREHLFSKYVDQVFARRSTADQRESMKWLVNLAKGMKKESQSAFYIENLQATWLYSSRLYMALVGLSGGIIAGLIVGIINGLGDTFLYSVNGEQIRGMVGKLASGLFSGLPSIVIFGVIGSLVSIVNNRWIRLTITVILSVVACGYILGRAIGLEYGLFLGFINGLLGGLICGLIMLNKQIYTIEALRFAMPSLRNGFKGSSQGFLIGVFLFGPIVELINLASQFSDLIRGKQIFDVNYELFFALLMIFFVGLIFGAIGFINTFIQPRGIEKKVQPNQGILSSIKSAFIAATFWGLIVGALDFFLGASGSILNLFLLYGIPSAFFYYGGATVLKHSILRLLLTFKSILPFRLVPFLDAMAEQVILRKVGGGYIFIHRYLLEYFAGME